ncbi:F-box/kelch-repeat protein At3g06240-like [Papaver somniferum]|uniref:F-box/kelch-repeat protein At3g06240-like n=1 Tax=Papaver somniferum TaxID=3469 RepID=UPI000E7027FE|nr:F-box/kelch-repeat protein At3g06240-like [Papaver somniferum]
MSGFPEEITVDILKRLPIKSVLKFRCVCKKWYDILNDPEFLKKQQNHDLGDDDSTLILRKGCDYYSISNDTFTSIASSSSSDVAISLSAKDVKDLDFPIISPKTPMPFIEETVQVLGSCKGLICFVLVFARIHGLLNPFTGEYRKLPSPGSSIPSGKSLFYNYGLGYDSKTSDYKLVRIAKSDENVPEVKVYTVGSNSWRSIENLDIPYVSCRGTSRFLNGCLHWIANYSFQTPRVIVSFDLGSETFKELALPENLRGGSNVCFSAAGGCLTVLCSDPCPWGRFDVWVMKDYGRRESWTRLFTITENIKSFEYIIRSFRHLR